VGPAITLTARNSYVERHPIFRGRGSVWRKLGFPYTWSPLRLISSLLESLLQLFVAVSLGHLAAGRLTPHRTPEETGCENNLFRGSRKQPGTRSTLPWITGSHSFLRHGGVLGWKAGDCSSLLGRDRTSSITALVQSTSDRLVQILQGHPVEIYARLQSTRKQKLTLTTLFVPTERTSRSSTTKRRLLPWEKNSSWRKTQGCLTTCPFGQFAPLRAKL
jgi:hypothetical protein